MVTCPSCSATLQIPAGPDDPGSSAPVRRQEPAGRRGWVEADHANVSIWVSLGIGAAITLFVGGGLSLFKSSYVGNVFTSGGLVNWAELLLFGWGVGIVILKSQKAKMQRNAMLLDVLPEELGAEINPQNVGSFIDHVYRLPVRLRDSFMTNRIRKGLEFFESRPHNQDVATLMASQSDIDASRIQGSYSLVKVFLWAIPILGFIGTVLGLSLAIGGLELGEAGDMDALMASLNNVIGGLGTAFNTTLYGLFLSLVLSFPVAAMQKREEDVLNAIDAFCNENLLTRINDGHGLGGGDGIGALDSIGKAVASAQREFLADLNTLSATVLENAGALERRAGEHQARIEEEFGHLVKKVGQETSHSVDESAKSVTRYVVALETGIRRLNEALESLSKEQVVIHQVKRKGWFGKGD